MNDVLLVCANGLLKAGYLCLVADVAKHFNKPALLLWFFLVILIDVTGLSQKAESKEESAKDAECEENNGAP